MSYLATAIVFLLIFSLLVLAHELGHFWAAKKVGIKVLEFGFGLPPRVWGFKKGETIYSINLIPFGGFVRLYGSEEAHADKRVMKSKRAFMNKPIRDRLKVVLAGVAMNFLLAWLFLTVGFSVGIEPLIVDSQGVLAALEDGTIVNEPGLVVKEVVPGSWGESVGLQPEDRIVSFLGVDFNSEKEFGELLKAEAIKPMGMERESLRIMRNGEFVLVQAWPGVEDEVGLKFYDFLSLPRTVVKAVKPYSLGAKIGFKPGDMVLRVAGRSVYDFNDLQRMVNWSGELEYEVFREGKVEKWSYENLEAKTMIAKVLFGSPAYKAGFREGDVIVEINGKEVKTPLEIQNISQTADSLELIYLVNRQGVYKRIPVTMGEERMIGIVISPVLNLGNLGLTVYQTDLVISVKEIKDVRYPVYQAPVKALVEMKHLSVVTAEMFMGVLKKVFGEGKVPAGVAGPVGMAQLTHVFMQQGFMALLRFTAVLSLSLAVINILPLPALDGGRFFFILIEAVRGKRNSPKIEAAVHAAGIVLLLILMFVITYNDIVRWVTGG